MTEQPTVFVVDDDEAVRKGLDLLLRSIGLSVETFGSAQEFLDRYEPTRPGCLVLDVRMPGMSGLELEEKLAEKGIFLPIIIITGHGDVPMAVKALKLGAFDFLEKPFRDQVLLDCIQRAIAKDAKRRAEQSHLTTIESRISQLSRREQQVMKMVVSGKPNKIIAAELGLSQKTVEFHRAHIMKKMKVESLAELVRLVTQAEDPKR